MPRQHGNVSTCVIVNVADAHEMFIGIFWAVQADILQFMVHRVRSAQAVQELRSNLALQNGMCLIKAVCLALHIISAEHF